MKKIVRGNDFTLRIPVRKIVNGEQVAFPLPACTDIVVNIVNQYRRVSLAYSIDAAEDSIINARVNGDAVSVGTYALEVRGKIFGNDWRSKEYEQFAIVDNNASGDTAFNGELIEGEDSVEMDTAFVFLPPTADLTLLINDANTAVETAKQTDATLKANEDERVSAEQQRASAEVARVAAESKRSESEKARQTAEAERMSNEDSRKAAEVQRNNAESERTEAEKTRIASETARVAAEEQRATTFTELSANVDAAVSKANSAAGTANTVTDKANTAEAKRTEAEGQRAEAELARSREEGIRQETETERIRKETARDTAEAARQSAEAERVKVDAEREKRVSEAISNASSATQIATDAAAVATDAGTKATTAATEAERVNVTLDNSVISVTNRNGETKTIDVVNTDEKVNVTITSSVDSIKVAGVKINVFINNGKTPQTYTTNSEGKVSFVVDRGNYYQITFTEYGNAQPIAPVGFTAVCATRNVYVDYKPYDEESMEHVVVKVTKYTDGTGAAYEGVPVVVSVGRKSTTYNTDTKGEVSVYVPYGKEYTINVDNQDGYYVSLNRNTRTYTAKLPYLLIDYRMYQFRVGIFVVDAQLNEYNIEEWQAAGKSADEAVAIKIADINLAANRGTFMIRTSDILAINSLQQKPWCTLRLQFYSIALNGNDTKDANYYNGEVSSFLVRQEAMERFLKVPAFDYAYEQIFSIAGHELHGFLMSVGQEFAHVANIGIIKQILTALYGEDVANTYYNFVMDKRRWTSTQNSAEDAWNFTSIAGTRGYKDVSFYVLPVFAC